MHIDVNFKHLNLLTYFILRSVSIDFKEPIFLPIQQYVYDYFDYYCQNDHQTFRFSFANIDE